MDKEIIETYPSYVERGLDKVGPELGRILVSAILAFPIVETGELLLHRGAITDTVSLLACTVINRKMIFKTFETEL